MSGKSVYPQATLTLRELNRATLARQMLLAREAIGAVEALERLAGLQAQYSPSPYIALWSRVEGFEHEQLSGALVERTAIKASLMRWTLHIVSARDYVYFVPVITELRTAGWRNIAAKAGLDIPTLHERLLEYTSEPRTQAEMIAYLNTLVPDGHDLERRIIWHSASAMGWLLHVPPSGTWRFFGKNPYLAARRWLGAIEPPPLEAGMVHMLRRYLAAYGPASRGDVVQWAGLRKVSPVDAAIKALGDEVITFSGENGSVLYDLADAPRPSADVPAPVRFLPKWDNMLLAYDDRERVLPGRYRKTVIKVNGDVMPSFIDGVVAGMWSLIRNRGTATLSMEPFEAPRAEVRSQLEEEGMQLMKFVEPDAGNYEIKFAS